MPGELERILAQLLSPKETHVKTSAAIALASEVLSTLTEVSSAYFGDQNSRMCLGLTCDEIEHIYPSPNGGETLNVDVLTRGLAGVMPA